MVERFTDKKISVLEQICENSFKANSVSDYGIDISEKAFIQILEQFQTFGWLKIDHISPLDISGTETEYEGKTLIHYKLINKKGLSDLLLKLKKEYPKRETPHIREKTLELIARDMGEFETGTGLINFLQKCGVEKELIIYPNTKWRMIYDILFYLSYSDRKNDWELLSSIICESIHPLMHNGDWEKSKQLCEKFNHYLIYDRLEINYSTKERKYKISYEPTEEEEDKINEELYEEWSSGIKEMLEFLKKPESKERITIIRKAYQVLINIAETFCLNPSKPTAELNDAYIKIKELIRRNALELKLIGEMECPEYYIHNLYFPFTNLFGAEAEYKNRNAKRIDWDEIRPELNRTFGVIDDIFRDVNGSDILSEPDIQKTLNDVSMLVSETKKKNESLKEPVGTKKILDTLDDTIIRGFQNMFSNPKQSANQKVQKIEISKLPEVKIEGLKEIMKFKQADGKPKFPFKLPRGTKWKNITIKFLDDDNVKITAKGKEHTENYKGMGFAGKKDASVLWLFLKILAKYYGEIVSSDPDANDKFKKQKELLSEKLENYFGLDYTDPFYPFQIEGKSEKSYRTKFQLIPPDDGFSFEKKMVKTVETKKKKNPFEDLQDFMNEETPIIAQIEKTDDGEIA